MAEILLVEDNRDISAVVEDSLATECHSVVVAPDGATGLNLLRKNKYDLIILDWVLPDMTGLDICSHYRAAEGTTPILFLTGKSAISEKENAFNAGSDDYLTKPFHVKELLARVRALLQTPKIPDRFSSHYEMLGEIGFGSMGVVYKARHRNLNRLVAIKTIRVNCSLVEDLIRLKLEAQALSSLDHPNIARVYDFDWLSDGTPYIVMELIDGITLQKALIQRGSMPPLLAVDFLLQIAQALAYVHDAGFIHRDLKPGNIILARTPEAETPKLLDFGLAKCLGQTADAQALTLSGEILGSPLYMSPEQSLGLPSDQRADIYAFGCLTFELLTGKPPFIGKNIDDTIAMRLTGLAPLVKDVRPDLAIPEDLQTLVTKCLHRRPEDRFNDFHQVKALFMAIEQKALKIHS